MSRRWLWKSTVGLMALVLAGTLALIIALALGWNNPRPASQPDWTAPRLPRRVPAGRGETIAALLDRRGGDFTLEALARPVAGPDSGFYGYGLIYRAQNAGRYYVFAVGGDGYYAVLRSEGERTTALVPWQQFPHIQRGLQANRLRVTCEGAVCRFFVNDEFATVVEDATWSSGTVGLWVRGDEGDVTAAFEQMKLWQAD